MFQKLATAAEGPLTPQRIAILKTRHFRIGKMAKFLLMSIFLFFLHQATASEVSSTLIFLEVSQLILNQFEYLPPSTWKPEQRHMESQSFGICPAIAAITSQKKHIEHLGTLKVQFTEKAWLP